MKLFFREPIGFVQAEPYKNEVSQIPWFPPLAGQDSRQPPRKREGREGASGWPGHVEELRFTDISVEDGLRMIVSGGGWRRSVSTTLVQNKLRCADPESEFHRRVAENAEENTNFYLCDLCASAVNLNWGTPQLERKN